VKRDVGGGCGWPTVVVRKRGRKDGEGKRWKRESERQKC